MAHKDNTHVNIEELLRFAKSLKDLSETLERYFTKTKHGLTVLGESHRDAKYEEFKVKFEDDLKHLQPLSVILKDYHDHIFNIWKPMILDYLATKTHK